jgi:hypothetical protein
LAPGIGEIIGGSQREERLEVLDRNMAERGIDREHYAPTLPSPARAARGGGLGRGYLRRYGTVPHAGFGLGFQRTLAHVTGHANVRDASPSRAPPATRGINACHRSARLGVGSVGARLISRILPRGKPTKILLLGNNLDHDRQEIPASPGRRPAIFRKSTKPWCSWRMSRSWLEDVP